MAQDTLLGFPAHTLPYRHGEYTALSTVSFYLVGLMFCRTAAAGKYGFQPQGGALCGASGRQSPLYTASP